MNTIFKYIQASINIASVKTSINTYANTYICSYKNVQSPTQTKTHNAPPPPFRNTHTTTTQTLSHAKNFRAPLPPSLTSSLPAPPSLAPHSQQQKHWNSQTHKTSDHIKLVQPISYLYLSIYLSTIHINMY